MSDWQSSPMFSMMMMYPQYQAQFGMSKGFPQDEPQQARLDPPPMPEQPPKVGGGLLGPSERPNMALMQQGQRMMGAPTAAGPTPNGMGMGGPRQGPPQGGQGRPQQGRPQQGGQQQRPMPRMAQAQQIYPQMLPFPYSYGRPY